VIIKGKQVSIVELTNGKSYIGSALHLKERFVNYFNINHLMSDNSMLINISLALEQMMILEFNPEYNVLKVAGSQKPAGRKRSSESMLPSMVKNYRVTYVDDKNKLIFIANSRSELARCMNLDLRNLSRILKEKGGAAVFKSFHYYTQAAK
jgi:hypothetical protein